MAAKGGAINVSITNVLQSANNKLIFLPTKRRTMDIKLYRHAEFSIKGLTDVGFGHLVTDGVNIYYFSKQSSIVFKKENGYTPMILDWQLDFMVHDYYDPQLRYINGQVYMALFSPREGGRVMNLYKNGKLLTNIVVGNGGHIPDTFIFGQDGYYTNLVYAKEIDDTRIEYVIEDDNIKINQNTILKKRSLFSARVTEMLDCVYIYDECNRRTMRIDADKMDKILQFVRENSMFPRYLSHDSRYIVFRGAHDSKYRHAVYGVKNMSPFVMQEDLEHTGTVYGTIDNYMYDSNDSDSVMENIHLFRDNIKYTASIKHNDPYTFTRYVKTFDGMLYSMRERIILYNTRWRWRDIELQDENVQKIAITAAFALKQAYGHFIDINIRYKIVIMLMEG